MTARIAAVPILFSALSMAACVGPVKYAKVDFNPQDFAADQSQCNAQANAASLGASGFFALAIFKKNKEMCMVGKGYTTMCGESPCDPQY